MLSVHSVTNMSIQTVGIVGIGRMGLPMARNLLETDFDVIVSDPDSEAVKQAVAAGAMASDSLSELGQKSDIVMITVPTGDDVQAVCSGDDSLLEGMTNGIVLVNSSTRPDLPKILQQEVPPSVSVVDAPMCRGEAAAKAGEILFLVGGDSEAVSRCVPALEACGEYTRLGETGAGQVGKTANNLLLWINVLADYEVLRLADALNVDPLALRDVLPESSGDNWAVRRGNWENLNLTWPEKDLAIAMDLADEAATPIPLTGLASQLMKQLEVSDLSDYYFAEAERVID